MRTPCTPYAVSARNNFIINMVWHWLTCINGALVSTSAYDKIERKKTQHGNGMRAEIWDGWWWVVVANRNHPMKVSKESTLQKVFLYFHENCAQWIWLNLILKYERKFFGIHGKEQWLHPTHHPGIWKNVQTVFIINANLGNDVDDVVVVDVMMVLKFLISYRVFAQCS